MRLCNFVISCLCAIALSGPTAASTLDAVSFLSVEHGFVVNGGGVPDGIRSISSTPSAMTFDASTNIDDPNASVVLDDSTSVVGTISSAAPSPFITERIQRTDRLDPTEFAVASYRREVLAVEDTGVATTDTAFGQRTVTRTGLAQARITSDPVAAEARSGLGNINLTQVYVNESDETISFNIEGFFDAYLLARYSGADGFARTATSIDLEISSTGFGTDAFNVLYFPLDTYFLDTDTVGPGASFSESLTASPSGVSGVRFSAATSAIGDGGFTEASLTASHRYLLNFTLDPGAATALRIVYGQDNEVGYTPLPGAPTPVPLPAGLFLLGSALALLRLTRCRSSIFRTFGC